MKKSNKEILDEVIKEFGANEGIIFVDRSKKAIRHPFEAAYSNAEQLILSAMDKAREDEKGNIIK
jgi:hypothetical protein